MKIVQMFTPSLCALNEAYLVGPNACCGYHGLSRSVAGVQQETSKSIWIVMRHFE